MRVLQINTTYDIGSTGRIVAGLERVINAAGHEAYAAFGYGNIEDEHHYKIINQYDSYCHNIASRLTDSQGLHSVRKTEAFVKYIEGVSPDIIHLHNIHGNYLDYRTLFNYLREGDYKVVWTFHDCWPFTGHCAYFDIANCHKWVDGCRKCPQRGSYPPALIDRCERNYALKSSLFCGFGERMVLVGVSEWLSDLLHQSFLKDYHIRTIHNGINMEKFRCKSSESAIRPYVLGVASPWDTRKGLKDFSELRKLLDGSIDIVLVGLNANQIKALPDGIIGLARTDSMEQLAELYGGALALVNPTYEDNYPTVNLESIACGTPVITYNTGGSPESLLGGTGAVVAKGNIEAVCAEIMDIASGRHAYPSDRLMRYATENFDENKCFQEYLSLYNSLKS